MANSELPLGAGVPGGVGAAVAIGYWPLAYSRMSPARNSRRPPMIYTAIVFLPLAGALDRGFLGRIIAPGRRS